MEIALKLCYSNIYVYSLNVGDCDTDKDCVDGYKCGSNNCPNAMNPSFDAIDDCCYNPATTSPASFNSKESHLLRGSQLKKFFPEQNLAFINQKSLKTYRSF